MYILSFYTINALKTQKNGRLLYVLLQYIVTCRPVRFREAEKHTLCILFAYTQKRPHILVTAPFRRGTLYPPDNTK